MPKLTIDEILNSPDMNVHRKASLLSGMVTVAMDEGDDQAKEAAIAALGKLSDAGRPMRYRPTRAANLMYDGRQKVLLLKEKHGDRHISAGSPDEFAMANLGVVQERLEQDYYRDSKPYVASQPDPILFSFLNQLKDKLPAIEIAPDAKLQAYRDVFRDLPDYQALYAREHIVDQLLAYMQALDAPPSDGAADRMMVLLQDLVERKTGGTDGMRLFLEGKGGPLTARLCRALPRSREAEAREILETARTSLRKAGRFAFDFLVNNGGEYEKVDIVMLETPSFTLPAEEPEVGEPDAEESDDGPSP